MTENAIAIVGAGFSGTILALHLLQSTADDVRIHLIERSGRFGPGLAYSTDRDGHLLNVPAGRMSAFADRESDFLDWLKTRTAAGEAEPTAATFAPRRLYGAYLQDRLKQTMSGSQAADYGAADYGAAEYRARRLSLVHDTVTGIEDRGASLSLHLSSGAILPVATAVLASGNVAPPPVSGVCASLAGTRFWCPNPWSGAALADLDPEAAVLLIGTGLTMVDTVISLLDRGHTGPIHAVSRRGLLARSHTATLGVAPVVKALPAGLRALVRRVRRDVARAIAAGRHWQLAIDALRPHTQVLWQLLSPAEQGRFLRHLRPFWDVHRHRMAHSIGQRIDTVCASGQLHIHAGRIASFTPFDATVAARIGLRGGRDHLTLPVARVINCTGLAADITQVQDSLLRGLLDSGMVRPDPLRLGLDVTPGCEVRAADGSASHRLLAIGPLTKGVLWEITAVPDIRRQCATVARQLVAAAATQQHAIARPESLAA